MHVNFTNTSKVQQPRLSIGSPRTESTRRAFGTTPDNLDDILRFGTVQQLIAQTNPKMMGICHQSLQVSRLQNRVFAVMGAKLQAAIEANGLDKQSADLYCRMITDRLNKRLSCATLFDIATLYSNLVATIDPIVSAGHGRSFIGRIPKFATGQSIALLMDMDAIKEVERAYLEKSGGNFNYNEHANLINHVRRNRNAMTHNFIVDLYNKTTGGKIQAIGYLRFGGPAKSGGKWVMRPATAPNKRIPCYVCQRCVDPKLVSYKTVIFDNTLGLNNIIMCSTKCVAKSRPMFRVNTKLMA